MEHCLLHLIVSPSLEESMVDWLLNQASITGFSSMVIYGHGSSESAFNLVEQVAGRQRRIQFVIHTQNTLATQLITTLKQTFAGAGVHYFVMPVTEFGRV